MSVFNVKEPHWTYMKYILIEAVFLILFSILQCAKIIALAMADVISTQSNVCVKHFGCKTLFELNSYMEKIIVVNIC